MCTLTAQLGWLPQPAANHHPPSAAKLCPIPPTARHHKLPATTRCPPPPAATTTRSPSPPAFRHHSLPATTRCPPPRVVCACISLDRGDQTYRSSPVSMPDRCTCGPSTHTLHSWIPVSCCNMCLCAFQLPEWRTLGKIWSHLGSPLFTLRTDKI